MLHLFHNSMNDASKPPPAVLACKSLFHHEVDHFSINLNYLKTESEPFTAPHRLICSFSASLDETVWSTQIEICHFRTSGIRTNRKPEVTICRLWKNRGLLSFWLNKKYKQNMQQLKSLKKGTSFDLETLKLLKNNLKQYNKKGARNKGEKTNIHL